VKKHKSADMNEKEEKLPRDMRVVTLATASAALAAGAGYYRIKRKKRVS